MHRTLCFTEQALKGEVRPFLTYSTKMDNFNSATVSVDYSDKFSNFVDNLMAPLKNFIIERVTEIPFSDKSLAFNIGDYGTADGSSSMTFMAELVSLIKEKHGSGSTIVIFYEDTDKNDFNALFRRLSTRPSFLHGVNDVFAFAVGKSFYGQCVPSNSMNIIFSFTATHWLSRKPTFFKNSIHGFHDVTTEEKESFRIQATRDWENFLLLRSKELKSGGILVVWRSPRLCVSGEEDKISCQTFLYTLNNIWKNFRNKGLISPEEFMNTNFGHWLLGLEELKQPLTNAPALKSSFEVMKAETLCYSTTAYLSWKAEKDLTGSDNRKSFAHGYISTNRCWAESTFMEGLSDTRTQTGKYKLVNRLFREAETEVENYDPEVFEKDLVMCAILLRKFNILAP